MRLPLLFAAALAAVPAASTPPPRPMDLHFDVPQGKGPQHVNVLVREFPVGGSSGWHTHPGAEIAYLVAGELTLEEAGQPTRRLRLGDSFLMPRGVAHNGANVDQEPARLVITYVLDKDAPQRSAAPAPR